MLKIGILGAGHLGKIHLKILKEMDSFYLVGFFDSDSENAQLVEKEFGVKAFDSAESLIESVDALDIVTPTLYHHYYACKAIRAGKHVFIEKPISSTLAEGKQIEQLAEEAGLKVQIGHVERFNPAFIAGAPFIDHPMFIESHRLAQFNPRGTDVSVILDLMIHDIDIVLNTINSGIKKINASGVSVVSDSPDIANARLEFDNGCVANLTASRLSLKNMRKIRFFQRDAYISIDFLEKETEIIRLKDADPQNPFAINLDLGPGKGTKQIDLLKPEILSTNAIKSELESFSSSISFNQQPVVSASDGLKALEIAFKIIEKLNPTSQPLD